MPPARPRPQSASARPGSLRPVRRHPLACQPVRRPSWRVDCFVAVMISIINWLDIAGGVDGGYSRQAGGKADVLDPFRMRKNNLDRHALYDFHEIAGGVFRWEHRESLTAAGLNGLHSALEVVIWIGIDMNGNGQT